MESDQVFFHDPQKRRRSQIVDVMLVLIPVSVILFAIIQLSQNNDKYTYIYMFCAIILLAAAIERKKTVDIKLTDEGIEFAGGKPRFYPYSRISNIECVRYTKSVWFVIQLWTDTVITIEADKNEKYCLRRSQVQDFDLLWERLKIYYSGYLDREYCSTDIGEVQLYFGQRLWIKGGKLTFSYTYDVPLKSISARFNEKGFLEVIYLSKDGNQKTWITLDSEHFQKTFLLYYLLNKNASFEINDELLEKPEGRKLLRFIT